METDGARALAQAGAKRVRRGCEEGAKGDQSMIRPSATRPKSAAIRRNQAQSSDAPEERRCAHARPRPHEAGVEPRRRGEPARAAQCVRCA